jgi:hypothetical protein
MRRRGIADTPPACVALPPCHAILHRMDTDTLIVRIADAIKAEPPVQALLLAGSHGRGTADRFSDVDLIAVLDRDDIAAFALDWRLILDEIVPIVCWHQRAGAGLIINAISETWHRVDMVVTTPDALTGVAGNTVNLLIDRMDLAAMLPDRLAPRTPDTARVRYLIHEFLRVLGLLPVVVGRGEFVTAVAGAAMQRSHLIELMVEDLSMQGAQGALHLSRILPPDQMAVLTDIAYPQATAADVIIAHAALAKAFLPRAHALAERLGMRWPDAFEAATCAYLERALGMVIAPSQ